MSDETTTEPGSFSMLDIEKFTPGIDFAARLSVGESLSSPTSELVDIRTNTAYAAGLSGSPSISGTQVLQTLHNLEAGHQYWLVLGATVSATKIIGARVRVIVTEP